MGEARQRAEWDRAALLASVVHNCAFGRERRHALAPADFHPYSRSAPAEELPEVPFEMLKLLFVR